MKIDDEALAEWRAYPATEAVHSWAKALLRQEEAAFKDAAWAGNPWPEDHRRTLRRMEVLVEGFFEASAADFAAMIHEAGNE